MAKIEQITWLVVWSHCFNARFDLRLEQTVFMSGKSKERVRTEHKIEDKKTVVQNGVQNLWKNCKHRVSAIPMNMVMSDCEQFNKLFTLI